MYKGGKEMMRSESEIVPYHSSNPPGDRVIVFAPHPDDETLGCGGTIRLLIEAGKKIKVVFLTSGDKAERKEGGAEGFFGEAYIHDYSLMREKEAERALKVLGVSDHEFLRFPDRGLEGEYENVLDVLLKAVEEFAPDAIYAPSVVELNPDHRTTAALAMEIQRMCENSPPAIIVFYEVTTPFRPNILVDISSVYNRKKKAVKQYKSQLRLMDYLRHITAMNMVRALTVRGPRYVEAFWAVDRPLSGEEIREWMSYEKVRSEK